MVSWYWIGKQRIKLTQILMTYAKARIFIYSKFGALSSMDFSFLKVCKLNILLNSGAEWRIQICFSFRLNEWMNEYSMSWNCFQEKIHTLKMGLNICLQSIPVSLNIVCPSVENSDHMTEWPSDRVSKWPSDLVTKWPSDQVTKWPSDWVTNRLDDRMTGSFADDWPYGIFY